MFRSLPIVLSISRQRLLVLSIFRTATSRSLDFSHRDFSFSRFLAPRLLVLSISRTATSRSLDFSFSRLLVLSISRPRLVVLSISRARFFDFSFWRPRGAWAVAGEGTTGTNKPPYSYVTIAWCSSHNTCTSRSSCFLLFDSGKTSLPDYQSLSTSYGPRFAFCFLLPAF